MSVGKIFF